MKMFAGLLCLSMLLAGCTWVKLTPEGAGVVLLDEQSAAQCERLGTTTVEVLDRTLLQREADKVAEELETLARNRVADRANGILAISDVEEGQRTYALFRCP